MRALALLILLTLLGCFRTSDDTPQISGPAAEHRRSGGTLHTINDMSRLAPITQIAVNSSSLNEQPAVRPEQLEELLVNATPIAANDKLLEAWHYAPWCSATFISGGRKWPVQLLLGGLGFISDAQGRKAAFRFEMDRKE